MGLCHIPVEASADAFATPWVRDVSSLSYEPSGQGVLSSSGPFALSTATGPEPSWMCAAGRTDGTPTEGPSSMERRSSVSTHQPEPSGTYFLLPPHHRLFAIFDDPVVGSDVAAELRAHGVLDDVWTFFGEKGVETLDPGVRHHGVPVAVVRVLQRLMTNDCEYCDGLSSALRRGAMVLAARTSEAEVEGLCKRLRRYGGHTFAFGEHWNFVPMERAEHTIGFFPSGEAMSNAARTTSEVK